MRKPDIRHDLPPLLSRILCSSLLLVDDFFSVCFQGRLRISFSRCSSLDVCIFSYAFSCSLSLSSCRILAIIASFLTILRVFRDSLCAFYFLLSLSFCLFLSSLFSLKTLSPQAWIRTIFTGCCKPWSCLALSWIRTIFTGCCKPWSCLALKQPLNSNPCVKLRPFKTLFRITDKYHDTQIKKVNNVMWYRMCVSFPL